MEKTEKPENSVEDIANYFLAYGNEVGESISNLKLQKLVYYAQAWHLANLDRPLFEEDFQAWVHGPVIPELYHKYKERGSAPILTELRLEDVERSIQPESLELLREVVEAYMPDTAYTLELMTHREDPWIEAREGLQPDERCENIIQKERMHAYYGARISNKEVQA